MLIPVNAISSTIQIYIIMDQSNIMDPIKDSTNLAECNLMPFGSAFIFYFND